jgi:hypothetical protein
MRLRVWIGSMLVALALQGCAGTASVLNQTQQKSLQSLQLFNADSSPRFSFYLACTSDDVSCVTAENAFSTWSQNRNIAMRPIESDDVLFTSGISPSGRHDALPYRLAIRLAPLIIPSYDASGGVHGDMHGGYTPPKVGYTGTVYVFDATTGKLLLDMSVHEQRTADYKGDASEYIRSEMNTLIGNLDPAYPHN